jgi:hypothetical protein
MRRTALVGAALALLVPLIASLIPAAAQEALAKKKTGKLKLVGHSPLENRGMNAALAVHNGHAYIGSRTDGKPLDMNLTNAGVMVVDVRKPKSPEVVGTIEPPHEGNEGETSREMRVWRSQDILIVMNLGSNCAAYLHLCSPRTVDDNFRFYDISGKNAAKPKFIAEYKPSMDTHEFFLWEDPDNKKRALMFSSTPSGPRGHMLVTDISGVRKKKFKELGEMPAVLNDGYLHSASVSNDGKTAYMAYNSGGFVVADVSEFTKGVKKPSVRLITAPEKRPDWDGPSHSSVKLFGKDYVLNTDEMYGEALRALGAGGCPWAWARMIDIKNPVTPKVVADYRLEQNHQDFCTTDVPKPSSTYSAHNPTLTKSIAFISWHAGGLQAVDVTNPKKPTQLADFIPEPLPYVVTEDPALSGPPEQVAMWSYPVIVDGLIYVVDVRNGLYILKYSGAHAKEVNKVDFIEGNSNQGDALRFEKP